ncbi:hypothetical protein INR49_020584 [Caranx melampygus]|nr:hypothetical protein INR49_020584 [Caranx melampygus]
MLVVMASLDGSTPVETLLSAIHLERYLNTFCGAGLLSARDFTHLDHEALVSLGITATGHRKRILRLVSHIQRTEAQRANQKVDTDSPRDRCHSVRDGRSTVDFEAFRNSSAPNLAAMLAESESTSSRTVVKPVPNPERSLTAAGPHLSTSVQHQTLHHPHPGGSPRSPYV